MIKTVSAMEVRQNFGELINEVQYKHSSVIIKRCAKEVAAIVSLDLFDRIRSMREEFDRLTNDLRKSLSSLEAKDLDEAINFARKRQKT